MGKIIASVLLLLTAEPFTGKILLNKIPYYKQDSYFKSQVYQEKTVATFYQMPEANQTFHLAHFDFHLLNAALFFATNKLREENGLKPLAFSPGLRDAATIHTDQMVQKNFFSHYNTSGPKWLNSPKQRMLLFTKVSGMSGENCDMNFIDEYEQLSYIQVAQRILDDLYSSPPHREILLEPAFHYLGCAVVFEQDTFKDGTAYLKATQDFAGLINR